MARMSRLWHRVESGTRLFTFALACLTCLYEDETKHLLICCAELLTGSASDDCDDSDDSGGMEPGDQSKSPFINVILATFKTSFLCLRSSSSCTRLRSGAPDLSAQLLTFRSFPRAVLPSSQPMTPVMLGSQSFSLATSKSPGAVAWNTLHVIWRTAVHSTSWTPLQRNHARAAELF